MSEPTVSQKECIEHLGPLLVTAGAGSGKTHTLISRIVYALSQDTASRITVENILAITFTEKAASEIKGRARAALRTSGRVADALAIDGAWISTIHGLCQRILRIHALELGLDPAFTVLDGIQQQELLDEAIDQVISYGNKASIDYDGLALEYGLRDNSKTSVKPMLVEVIKQASYLPGGIGSIDRGPSPKSLSPLVRNLVLVFEELAGLGTDAQQQVAQRNIELLQDCLDTNAESLDTFRTMLERIEKPKAAGKAKELVVEILRLTDRAQEEYHYALSYTLTGELLSLAEKCIEAYEILKKKKNCVDLSGLIRLVLEAFVVHPEITQAYRQKFKLVMVDEFQDTNQLQISLIEQLAGKNNEHLCTVGDAQQSIYAFLGADTKVYAQHKHDMRVAPVKATAKELKVNFRSHSDILAFVRTVCGQEGYFDEAFLDLSAGRDEQRLIDEGRHYKSGTPRIDVMLTTYKTGSAEEACKHEARAIADRFFELGEAGHSAGDMVVLLGSMSKAHLYADALREVGFSCIVAGGSGFFQADEVQMVGQLLNALANPADTCSLYSVLAGDMFMLSDDELLKLATAWDQEEVCLRKQSLDRGFYTDEQSQPSKHLEFVHSVLVSARDLVGIERPSKIVRHVLVGSGWLARLEKQGATGEATAGNLFKALRLIEEVEAEPDFDMAQVARKFNKLHGEKESPGALMTDEDHAVRIMTIHSSKGLEFPIVAVAECFDVRAQDEQMLLMKDRAKAYLSIKPNKSLLKRNANKDYQFVEESVGSLEEVATPAAFRSLMLLKHKEEAVAEKRRLFYVALTRASEALVVAMTCATTANGMSTKPIHEAVCHALFNREGAFALEDTLVPYGGAEPLRYSYYTLDKAGAEEACLISEERKYIELSQTYAVAPLDIKSIKHDRGISSYTSLSCEMPSNGLEDEERLPKGKNTGEKDSGKKDSGGKDPGGKGPGGKDIEEKDSPTNFGNAFHRLGQLAVLVSPEQTWNQFDSLLQTYTIKDEERLRKAFQEWLCSKPFAKAIGFTYRKPEVPFCVMVKRFYLEGEVDLLCYNKEGGTAYVVDYKTGGTENEQAAALQKKHLFQAQCYAYALLKYGFESIELEFVRVEHLGDSEQDAVRSVIYVFDQADLPTLEGTLLDKFENRQA